MQRQRQSLPAGYVPVAQQYGWPVGGGIVGQYGAELMLGMAVLGIGKSCKDLHEAYIASVEPGPGKPADEVAATW
ncbi:MAG: hypothetical protein QM771_19015 [Nitrospira sp.]